MNSSATGGYLQPTSAPPLDDQALFRFVQQWLVGILNTIPGTLFFPLWQLEPPNYPGQTTDWAAVGIEVTPAQEFPYITHVDASGAQPAYDQYEMHEWIDIRVSLYGPNCNSNARALRDGVYIAQNRDVLGANEMALTETGPIRTRPSLIKERWQYGVDLHVRLRRRIVRQYAIYDVLSANGTVNNEIYTIPIQAIRPEGIAAIVDGFDTVAAQGTVH